MNWSFVEVEAFLASYAEQWDALNRRLYSGHPLSDSRFVFALLRHFPAPELRVAVLGAPESPRAILLLEPILPGIWASFRRSQAQISPVLLARDDVAALEQLFPKLSPFTQAIDFLCQDPHYSPLIAHAGRFPTKSVRHTLTASIDLRGHFTAYWRARPRGLRQTIARVSKRVEADGSSIALRCVEDVAGVAQSVREFGLLESRGWKADHGTAVSPDNAQGAFYDEVFRAFAASGQALAYELDVGDETVARQLALASGRMCITLKTTYDERYKHIAPGRVLDYEMLRAEFERRRFEHMELYTDADQAQLRWTTSDRWIEHVTCFRSWTSKTTYTVARSVLGKLRVLGGDRIQPALDRAS